MRECQYRPVVVQRNVEHDIDGDAAICALEREHQVGRSRVVCGAEEGEQL
jgi:hypothetical protein